MPGIKDVAESITKAIGNVADTVMKGVGDLVKSVPGFKALDHLTGGIASKIVDNVEKSEKRVTAGAEKFEDGVLSLKPGEAVGGLAEAGYGAYSLAKDTTPIGAGMEVAKATVETGYDHMKTV